MLAAKEYLEETISVASAELEELRNAYFAMRSSERTYTQYGVRMAEQIQNLEDSIEYMLKADTLLD